MSPRSFARWQAFASLVRPPLDAFDPCLAQDETTAERLQALGAEAPSANAAAFLGALFREAQSFAGTCQEDDQTVVVVTRDP